MNHWSKRKIARPLFSAIRSVWLSRSPKTRRMEAIRRSTTKILSRCERNRAGRASAGFAGCPKRPDRAGPCFHIACRSQTRMGTRSGRNRSAASRAVLRFRHVVCAESESAQGLQRLPPYEKVERASNSKPFPLREWVGSQRPCPGPHRKRFGSPSEMARPLKTVQKHGKGGTFEGESAFVARGPGHVASESGQGCERSEALPARPGQGCERPGTGRSRSNSNRSGRCHLRQRKGAPLRQAKSRWRRNRV